MLLKPEEYLINVGFTVSSRSSLLRKFLALCGISLRSEKSIMEIVIFWPIGTIMTRLQ